MSCNSALLNLCFVYFLTTSVFLGRPGNLFTNGVTLAESASKVSINAPADLGFTETGLLYIWEARGDRITAVYADSGLIQQRVSIAELGRKTPIGTLNAITAASASDLFISTEKLALARLNPAGDIDPLVKNEKDKIYTDALATTNSGDVLIADSFGNRVILWDPNTKRLTLIAGIGGTGYSGDGGPARLAKLRYPSGVAALRNGDIVISDSGNCRLRLVDHVTSTIRTIAGTGSCNSSGDGGPALQADLALPRRIAVDNVDNIYVVEGGANRVRRIATTGIITTFAGNGKRESTGDGGPADKAGLANPSGIAIDAQGDVYIAEYVGNRVRRIDSSSSIITTIAGNGLPRRSDPIL